MVINEYKLKSTIPRLVTELSVVVRTGMRNVSIGVSGNSSPITAELSVQIRHRHQVFI